MSKTKLTIYQGIYLFSKLAEAKIDINKLKIDNNDLSLVPPEYLSKGIPALSWSSVASIDSLGVNKVTEVDLCGTRLTEVQVSSIFLEMIHHSAIQKIALDGTYRKYFIITSVFKPLNRKKSHLLVKGDKNIN